MASINKAILVGRLGKDPETRYTSSGEGVTTFSLATTDSWKDRATGEKKEQTEWHRCVAYGKVGEICSEYLTKGQQVYIEGNIKTRSWEDQSGATRYVTEIRVNSMQMLSRKDDNQQNDGGFEQQPGRQQQSQQRQSAGGGHRAAAPTSVADLDDDIPFNQLPARYDI